MIYNMYNVGGQCNLLVHVGGFLYFTKWGKHMSGCLFIACTWCTMSDNCYFITNLNLPLQINRPIFWGFHWHAPRNRHKMGSNHGVSFKDWIEYNFLYRPHLMCNVATLRVYSPTHRSMTVMVKNSLLSKNQKGYLKISVLLCHIINLLRAPTIINNATIKLKHQTRGNKGINSHIKKHTRSCIANVIFWIGSFPIIKYFYSWMSFM